MVAFQPQHSALFVIILRDNLTERKNLQSRDRVVIGLFAAGFDVNGGMR